jgi:hypothetical protein
MLAGLFEANRGEGEGVSGGTAVAADLGDELTMPVRDHLVWVHNVVQIECIFGSGKPQGAGILGKGSTWATGNTRGSVYEQQGAEVDGSCHSKEGSK